MIHLILKEINILVSMNVMTKIFQILLKIYQLKEPVESANLTDIIKEETRVIFRENNYEIKSKTFELEDNFKFEIKELQNETDMAQVYITNKKVSEVNTD